MRGRASHAMAFKFKSAAHLSYISLSFLTYKRFSFIGKAETVSHLFFVFFLYFSLENKVVLTRGGPFLFLFLIFVDFSDHRSSYSYIPLRFSVSNLYVLITLCFRVLIVIFDDVKLLIRALRPLSYFNSMKRDIIEWCNSVAYFLSA